MSRGRPIAGDAELMRACRGVLDRARRQAARPAGACGGRRVDARPDRAGESRRPSAFDVKLARGRADRLRVRRAVPGARRPRPRGRRDDARDAAARGARRAACAPRDGRAAGRSPPRCRARCCRSLRVADAQGFRPGGGAGGAEASSSSTVADDGAARNSASASERDGVGSFEELADALVEIQAGDAGGAGRRARRAGRVSVGQAGGDLGEPRRAEGEEDASPSCPRLPSRRCAFRRRAAPRASARSRGRGRSPCGCG